MHFTLTLHDLTADDLRTVTAQLGIKSLSNKSSLSQYQPELFSEVLAVSQRVDMYEDSHGNESVPNRTNIEPLRKTRKKSDSSRMRWTSDEDALITTLASSGIEPSHISEALLRKCNSKRSTESIRCRIWKLARLDRK